MLEYLAKTEVFDLWVGTDHNLVLGKYIALLIHDVLNGVVDLMEDF